MQLTDQQVRDIVADALVRACHGNEHFIRSIRAGEQDDGPFMRGAFAVREAARVDATV